MTEQEARDILNEHRSVCPTFVRRRYAGGFWIFKVRRDGRTVDVLRAPQSRKRATLERTVAADDATLPADIRARLR